MQTFPSLVRERRQARRLSQFRLAVAAGISPSEVQQIETGKIALPRVATLLRIAAALEIEPAQLAAAAFAQPTAV
jgi:transcriptional regulator with XRE-family HTH domain